MNVIKMIIFIHNIVSVVKWGSFLLPNMDGLNEVYELLWLLETSINAMLA